MRDGEITQLITAWLGGNKGAENALFEALYYDLHRRAISLLRGEPAGQSMGPTALVHEAYLRLERAALFEINDRKHFINLAARVMHSILVDRARARLSIKRRGDRVDVEDLDNLIRNDADADEILAVDAAMDKLRAASPRQAQVVELRYFAGCSVHETATALGISDRTVRRDWDAARVRLQIAIAG